MTARALMVWGCTSDAGKSFLATALCRWYADRGLRVAPFKAQNMSNNARVVDDGEIGCAQWFQAMAARRTPEVRHNPVLLKPESDTRSQVVVMGQVDWELTCMDWRSRSVLLWDRARVALRELLEENDLVVMEGAGSPSEINLSSCDFVNLHSVREADARCIMVSDIDRGGAFAHLFGTWSLLPDDLKGRVDGFVLNKFRGNPGLLAPGPELLRERTGVPLLGTLPRIAHQLPDEDAVALEQFATALRGEVRHRVGIVAWPRISNFDEFRRLAAWPGVEVRLVRQPSHCLDLDLLVLPGSKNVPSDLQWLRERGLDREIERFAHGGGPVLGICGGFQALGGRILDPVGAEGDGVGLGLLDVRTVHGPAKRTGCVRSRAP
ncbi:MAG TPA: cobyric acid synthase, partial [Fibrobacteria bacterium]|nr:cobyric acid synthase [Fibrobacteria bacterium]